MTKDVAFHDACNQFDTAIDNLIGMRWMTVRRCENPDHRPDCACHDTDMAWQPPLYTQIRDEVDGLSGVEGKGVSESRPPLWVDGIDWVHEVDALAREMLPDSREGTAARFDTLSRASYGPDHTDWLRTHTTRITRLVDKGEVLLRGEEVRRLDVVAPCPECHTTTVYRKDSGGDIVRQTALQLTVNGCTCVACGTRWDRDHLNFLAEVIGCERKELA